MLVITVIRYYGEHGTMIHELTKKNEYHWLLESQVVETKEIKTKMKRYRGMQKGCSKKLWRTRVPSFNPVPEPFIDC